MVAGLSVLALACRNAERPAGVGEAPVASRASASENPASPGPWIAEIRNSLRLLPAEVEADPVAARRRAVDLYVSRQEAIERAWGPGGTAGPDSALAAAVVEAEASFHRLLALLNDAERPDSSAVAQAVLELDDRLLEVAGASGAAPRP